jgi:taurine dioxygenase
MLSTHPLSESFGVEARDVDLAQPMTDDAFAAIERVFFEGQVLVIRGQTLTPSQFVAFARRFGPPEPHVIDQFHHPADPNILILSNRVEHGAPARPRRRRHVFPHRLFVPRRAGARDDAVLDRGAGRRRRHAVRQPVRSVRRSSSATKRRIDPLVAIHHYGNRNNETRRRVPWPRC